MIWPPGWAEEGQITAFEDFVVDRARQVFTRAASVYSAIPMRCLWRGCTSALVDGLEAVGPFRAGHAERGS